MLWRHSNIFGGPGAGSAAQKRLIESQKAAAYRATQQNVGRRRSDVGTVDTFRRHRHHRPALREHNATCVTRNFHFWVGGRLRRRQWRPFNAKIPCCPERPMHFWQSSNRVRR
jgi:hypothetical protein